MFEHTISIQVKTNTGHVHSPSKENSATVAYQSILLPLPASPFPLPADGSIPQFFVQLLLDPENKLQPPINTSIMLLQHSLAKCR